MRIQTLVTLATLVLVTAPVARAQEPVPLPSGGEQASAAAPGQTAAPRAVGQQSPADDLGISVDRIRRELRETPPTRTNLLRYDFHVEVYGTNPKVDFFKDFDLSPNGPVRYGGMTHAEFLNVVTPQAFRAPSADLLNLAVLGLQELAKRSNGGSSKR